MKRSASNLAKITLGLVVSAGVFACKQAPTETKATAAAPVDAKATIVYVNQDTLSEKYLYAVDMRKRLEDKGKDMQADINSRRQALQRELAEAQKSAATMTQDQQRALGEKIQKDQGAEQTFEQRAGAEFQQAQSEESKKLYEKVLDFTKTYAKDKGYKMIFTFQNGNATMLYGDPSLDITADFMKKLNDAYKK